MSEPGLRYRPDIDGLRAVAVVPVVLFHLGLGVPGGFVGVDVFFVISGYLMTRIIAGEIGEGRFSILRFYERRARRILPALFAMLIATSIAALVIFMPDELRDLGTRVVAVALFASNILFWNQADYFAGPVELEPLIHTWSLAVEEQFYILFPLLLIALARWRIGARVVIWGLAGASLAASVVLLPLAPTATYYLLPTRAWELLGGSLLALGAIPRIRHQAAAELVAAAGLAAILGAALLLTDRSPFPGLNALWPVLGTMAVMHAGEDRRTATGRLLGARPLVAIGLVSYSLYLIHWPLIVFTRYQLLHPLTLADKLALLAAMVPLAWLSWRFIEQPFRDRRRVGARAVAIGSAAAIVVACAAGLVAYRSEGLPQRFPELARLPKPTGSTERTDICFMREGFERWSPAACTLAHGEGPPVLLWGDSHANHYRGALAGARLGRPVLLYASAGCVPILGAKQAGRRFCTGNNAHVPALVRQLGIREVVLSGNWETTLARNGLSPDDIGRTVRQLRAMGLTVHVIGDSPTYSLANPQYLAYRLLQRPQPLAPFFATPTNDRRLNARLRALVGADAFFDPFDTLCDPRVCLVFEGGHLVMNDTSHLSNFGAARVMDRGLRAFLQR